MIPPALMALLRDASVQLEGVPLPTTRAGLLVLTGVIGGTQTATGAGGVGGAVGVGGVTGTGGFDEFWSLGQATSAIESASKRILNFM